MSEPHEIKKAKIDSLIDGFTRVGYQSSNRIGQTELILFLNKRTSSGRFDHILAEKLFQVLNLDHMSTMFVEDFINGYLQFEEDIRRNAEIFNLKLNQEKEIYAKLAEQCRRYKEEQLNAEGLCENAKVYGEITDIDIKKKLEGIKEIIIKVIYNDKSEELHFKIGDSNSDEMKNKSFGFKPTSRKDHFEFIMKGVNDRNQVFDIGSKIFPLTDINSYEEYIVQIVVPEIDNEEEIAAYIHAKIVLYWSDYKYYEKQKRKAESRLKKLTSATNKANEYLKLVREIYGDLTRKKPDIIVDFNNEKLMQRKGGKLNVNFNNQKEAEAPGGNYLVEFNNLREVKKIEEPIKVEFNNTKEVVVQKETTIAQETLPYITKVEEEHIQEAGPYITKVEEEHIQETGPYITKVEEEHIQETGPYITKVEDEHIQETGPYITKVEEEHIQETGPYITKVEEEHIQETGPYITKVEEEHIQETGPYISSVEETQNVEYLQPQTDYTYLQQTQTETNYVQNGGQEFNMDEYLQQNGNEAQATTTTTTTNYEYNQNQYLNGQEGMIKAETIGYGATDNMGNVQAYGTGGYEYIDNNQAAQLRDSEIIKKTEIRTSVNHAMVNESTNKALISQSTLPVQILEAKVNKPIYVKDVKILPIINTRTSVTYENPTTNIISQSTQVNQVYNIGEPSQAYGNTMYSANI